MKGAPFVMLSAFLWGLWPLFLRQSDLPGYASGFVAMAVVSLAAIPVVVMSGGCDLVQAALHLRAAATIPKPFDVVEVLDVIARVLSQSPQQTAQARDRHEPNART